MNTLRQPLFREATTALLVALLLLQSATAVAPGPAWWGTHNVTDPAAAPDDFAVANAGQLKHMARKAMLAMDADLPGGAGAAIHALVDPWGTTEETATKPDNGLAINQGQLKHVATPFYDRLGLPYPWAGASAVTDNYALVNLGQLKHVFSFELKFRTFGGTSTAVTIPEAVLLAAQTQWNALGDEDDKPMGSTADDFDGDGIPNLQEYLMDPTKPLFNPLDIDGDRIDDAVEDDSGGILSKLDFADAVRDHDGDGVMNFEEVLLGLNLNGASTSGRADGLTDAEVLMWGLAAGKPLAQSADALRLFWQQIDAAWITENVGDGHASWVAADANGVRQESGFTAFQTDLAADGAWWLYPDVWFIENPTEVYDDEGSIIGFDRDNDGLPDLWEYRYELNLRGGWQDAWEDTDRDGLLDGDEYAYGTNPQLPDSDGDGFDDDAEMLNGGDPLDGTVVPTPPLTLEPVSGVHQYVGTGGSSAPLAVRVKQDGLPVAGAVVEFTTVSGGGTLRSNTSTATGTQVTVTTGSDGIASAVYLAGATPGSAVSIATLGGSGSQSVSFYLNILAGLGGTAAGGESVIRPWGGGAATQAPPPDADGDGIPDAWEIQHGLDPLVSNAGWDDDNDGFSDAEEYRLGSDMFDFDSHPGPMIEFRTKNYRGNYSKSTRDDGTGTIDTQFFGEAGLSDGETYLYVSAMNGSFPINDSPDRSQEMRTAFENGGYEALNPNSFRTTLRSEWQYVWSIAWSRGDPSGPLLSPWTKAVSGTAMELRLTPPTSANAPAEDWSRTYLVVEYSGAWEDYDSLLSLPLKTVLGSLNFSHTATGTTNVTFSGEAAGQVKISGNDRVEIIPREEMGQSIRIALCPIEFLAPDVPEQPMDLETTFFSDEPIAAGAGDPPPGMLNPEEAVEITDDKFKRVEELKVAKLTGAFMPTDSTNKEFILDSRYDPDAFRIVVRGLANNPAMLLTVNLQTTGLPGQGQFASLNDDATEIPLRFISNVYSTSRQLLVAHKEDDEYPKDRNIAPKDPHQIFGSDDVGQDDPDINKPSDRTHRAALGSNIQITAINVYGTPHPGSFPLNTVHLPVRNRRSISVSVYAFADSGVVANGQITSKVWSDLQTARDTLAQIGIQLEIEGSPQPIALPVGSESSTIEAYQFARQFKLPDGRPAAVARNFGIPSEAGKKLLEKCNTSNSKFTLIYCQDLLGNDGSPKFAGYAYPPSMADDQNKQYSNHAFVSGKNDTSLLAFVHELCHLLTNTSHFGPGQSYEQSASIVRTTNNLMRWWTPDYAPGVGKGCRLEAVQQSMIDKVLDSMK